MTRSSRILNRMLLALTGVTALGAALVLAVPAARAALPSPRLNDPRDLWILTGACAAIVVFALAWIATRGRGRTALALRTPELELDVAAVGTLVRDALASAPDVLAVRADAFRRRRGRVVLLTVRTRRRPDLPALRTRLSSAVAHLDQAVGVELPIVILVTGGVRTTLSRPRLAR